MISHVNIEGFVDHIEAYQHALFPMSPQDSFVMVFIEDRINNFSAISSNGWHRNSAQYGLMDNGSFMKKCRLQKKSSHQIMNILRLEADIMQDIEFLKKRMSNQHPRISINLFKLDEWDITTWPQGKKEVVKTKNKSRIADILFDVFWPTKEYTTSCAI